MRILPQLADIKEYSPIGPHAPNLLIQSPQPVTQSDNNIPNIFLPQYLINDSPLILDNNIIVYLRDKLEYLIKHILNVRDFVNLLCYFVVLLDMFLFELLEFLLVLAFLFLVEEQLLFCLAGFYQDLAVEGQMGFRLVELFVVLRFYATPDQFYLVRHHLVLRQFQHSLVLHHPRKQPAIGIYPIQTLTYNTPIIFLHVPVLPQTGISLILNILLHNVHTLHHNPQYLSIRILPLHHTTTLYFRFVC